MTTCCVENDTAQRNHQHITSIGCGVRNNRHQNQHRRQQFRWRDIKHFL
ncbi:Uncharacterised protein [Vibrio cholerae]|nr:Uncharacterised protein [Vibrio cholerae]CSI89073.1 Uncharacterised protein [Vibrio cholerae]